MFDETRLPEHIERASRGGPQWNTVVVVTASGAEQRIALWPKARLWWDISYGVLSQEDSEELIAFFRARQGRLRGFRFKDWLDYQAVDAPQTVYDTNKIQLYKRYTSGGVNSDRKITKPVAGTVTLKRNGDPYTDFTVSTTTGIVTLTGATDGVFTASFEFDVPVRFDTDRMESSAEDNVRSWNSIPIVELML